MRKKNIIAIVIFAIIALVLPYVIEWVFQKRSGTNAPYTQSDILTYSATVLGVLISMVALLTAKNADQVRLKIKHSLTAKGDEACIYIEICNDSNYDCEIEFLGFTNKLHNTHIRIVEDPSFIVKAKRCYDFTIEIQKLAKCAKFINTNNSRKILYEIRLPYKVIYLGTSDLFKYFECV